MMVNLKCESCGKIFEGPIPEKPEDELCPDCFLQVERFDKEVVKDAENQETGREASSIRREENSQSSTDGIQGSETK